MTRSGGKLSRKQKKSLQKKDDALNERINIVSDTVPASSEPLVVEEKIESTKFVENVEDVIPLAQKFSLTSVRGRNLALTIIAILCCLVYANSLRSPFVFDDLHNFIENPYTQIKEVSAKNLWYAATRSPSGNRWLPNVSFALNYYFGERDPLGYHLVNLFIHLLTGFLVYFSALKTLSLPRLKEYEKYRYEASLVAAALWMMHPLQTNAVTYLVQRMTSMAAFFCLFSVLMYVYGRTSDDGKKLPFFFMSLVSGFMAVVTKENSYMLPFMIGGYELFFLRPDNGFKIDKRKAGYAVAGVGMLMVIALFLLDHGTFSSLLDGYQIRDFTLGERLLTETRVVVLYVSLLLFPVLSRINLIHQFPVSSGIVSPPATFLAIVCLIFAAYLACRIYHRNRLLSFGLFWFFLNLLIESTFIPLELVYEHRLYLPSVFIFIALAGTLYGHFSQRVVILRVVMVLMVVTLGVLTWQRNGTWENSITFWNDVLKKSPDSARAYNNLAEAYTAKNDFAKSLYYYQKALVNKPQQNALPIILKNLGFALIVHGRYEEAMGHLVRSIRLNPKDPKTHLNLGIVYKKKGNMGRANYHYGQARTINERLFR
jgi:tetratricopeptide (TPR) repeat protein